MNNLTAKQQPVQWPTHTSDENLVGGLCQFLSRKNNKK